MAAQHGGEKQFAAGVLLLLLALLPLLVKAAGLGGFISDKDEPARKSEREWQLTDGEPQSPEASKPEVSVEATKKLWAAELAEKADSEAEAADLIEKIQSKTTGSGLRRLRSACKAICFKCICGLILLPSLPAVPPPKPVEKFTKGPYKQTKRPMVSGATPTPRVTSGAAKPSSPPPLKEPVKKTKKWLHMDSLESELPDFLLDEGGNNDAYKREVSDHDPLSQAFEESHIGIE